MPLQATLLIDGHVHIYSHYDLNYAINQGIFNLKRSAIKYTTTDKIVPIWFLVERHDCNFFEQAINSSIDSNLDGMKFIAGAEKETLIIEKNGEPILYLFAGRQIVTKDGLEILSLMTTLFLKNREQSINEVIDHVIDSGGIPVINWAPGKWFFSRGKIVERVLQSYSPENLLIGDTSLRTTLWPLPKLMAEAKSSGFKIIAGSDPLPFKDEEKQIGLYGFSVIGEFDEVHPVESIRKLLREEQTKIHLIGKRNNLLTFSIRQFKIMMDQS